MTFVETALLGCLQYASFTAFISSLLGMLVYKDLTSNVTSKMSSGIFSIWLSFWRKPVVSLTYDRLQMIFCVVWYIWGVTINHDLLFNVFLVANRILVFSGFPSLILSQIFLSSFSAFKIFWWYCLLIYCVFLLDHILDILQLSLFFNCGSASLL